MVHRAGEINMNQEDLEQRRKDRDERVKVLRERIAKLRADLITIGAAYFVFQGVIFSAVYRSPSKNKCHHRVVPTTLASIAGGFAIVLITLFMYHLAMLLKEKDNEIAKDLESGQVAHNVATDIQDFHNGRKVIALLVISFLGGFIGVNIWGVHVTPCALYEN